ncbi:MAG: hypothetical protein ACYTAS_14005 [Planctomycetota bacterium]|jgi:hypothetical protein
MINNINSNQVARLLGQPSPSNVDAASRPHNDADAALQVRFGDLINQARTSLAEDTSAIREARELLDSGRLTNAENIESAANNMLTYGI